MNQPDLATSDDRDESRGWLFWGSFVVGWATIGFGVWTVFVRAGAIHPLSFGAWFLALTLVHDLVVAPAISAAAMVLSPRLPPGLRSGVVVAAIVSGALIVVSLPPFLGVRSDNETILPRNYAAGLAAAIAATWIVAAIGILVARRRARSIR